MNVTNEPCRVPWVLPWAEPLSASMVPPMSGFRVLVVRIAQVLEKMPFPEALLQRPLQRAFAFSPWPIPNAPAHQSLPVVTRMYSTSGSPRNCSTDSLISQGSALMAAALTDATTAVRNNVVGTVLFGYTKNLQNRGEIPGYPSDRLKVFCAVGDLVCSGTLSITAAHLSYNDEAAREAPEFLISKIGA